MRSVTSMERARLLELVVALACEFSRRGMPDHCDRLRLYYLALRHGLDSARHRVEIHWDEGLVIEWMRLLRLPPYQDHYPVSDTTACAACESRPGHQGASFPAARSWSACSAARSGCFGMPARASGSAAGLARAVPAPTIRR